MRTSFVSLVTLVVLAGCTGATSAAPPATMPAASRTSATLEPPCDKSTIRSTVERFVRAWNTGDTVALREALTPGADINVSSKTQGAHTSTTGLYTTSTGWMQIRRFAERQHELGQHLSYARLRVVVAGEGAYPIGMRATYADGSQQSFADAKFAYSCDEQGLHRVVLVASAPAR